MKTSILAGAAAALCVLAATAHAATQAPPAKAPWLDTSASPAARAKAAVAAMTDDEKLSLVFGFADPDKVDTIPDAEVSAERRADVAKNAILGGAGYVPGIPRLGIPAQYQTDASIGVRVEGMARTALPSSLATAASFDPKVSEAGGRMIAHEARLSGFNVLLAGGANLDREPRGGRNFEYVGEDPLLAGAMAGGLIRGIQSQHIQSTMKHFAVNSQETLRETVNSEIDRQAMRQSDLLAFQMVLEQGHPTSAMCAYNKVNGYWACENDYLLNKVLKQGWGFEGYVMSDWGAVHSNAFAANAGLDQLTGFRCCGDKIPHFAGPLKQALATGDLSHARLDDMATRILWALFASGSFDDPQQVGPIDFEADAQISRQAAEQSLTLLKNEGKLLPLAPMRTLAVIGGRANLGVMSGGGSSDVHPVGGNPLEDGTTKWPDAIYDPSAPLKALQQTYPNAQVRYDAGSDPAQAARLAAASDTAIVFVTQHTSEERDASMDLGAQDALVQAVAAANPRTIVVVESGGAVFMPWLDKVPAVLEAFYPGQRGGEAIADIVSGKVNPSGHLPISFPASPAQFAHAVIEGTGQPNGTAATVVYKEGAAIGYKWYDLKDMKPMFAFGHGLSYTSFALSQLKVQAHGNRLSARVTVTNTGERAGAAVPQLYALAPGSAHWEAPKRLVGFDKVLLAPGESRQVEVQVDPRLLATWNEAENKWVIRAGGYQIKAGQASDALPLAQPVKLVAERFGDKR
jgi:beta-glucosidase